MNETDTLSLRESSRRIQRILSQEDITMGENEMNSTLFQVAKMKAEFDLLKRAIIRSLTLDYTGEDLMLSSDRMVIEVMRIIEPAMIADILENEKDMKAQEKVNEIRAKELETIEKQYAITKDEAENILKEDDNG